MTDIKNITSKVDHTLLSQGSVWEEIKTLCDEAKEYSAASVCVAPCFVKDAKEYLKDTDVKVCTVIGFPNGYNTTRSKVFEAIDALENGADEIDMVINIGYVKAGLYDKVLEEINKVKSVCLTKTLKVIIETCLLTEQEKIKMCRVVSESGADFIKTSTGFSSGGATKEDIKLFSENVTNNTKIKAAGGINSLCDAKDFIELGAQRLGTSKIIKLLKKEKAEGGY